jgi:hypothetical protein
MVPAKSDEVGAAALTAHVYAQVLAGRRDMLEQLMHEDFTCGGTRDHIGRKEWLDRMLVHSRFDDITTEIVKADLVLHNAAIVTALVSYRGEQYDETLSGTWAVIDVWKRSGVDWLLLNRVTFPALS